MKKTTRDIIIKGVLLSLVPALCAYLGQPNNILDWLQQNNYIGTEINLEFVRQSGSILSIFLTFIFLTIPMIIVNLQSSSYESQRNLLIRNNKDIFQAILKEHLHLENCNLNVRIFVPRNTLLKKYVNCSKCPLKTYIILRTLMV